jgi:hypothetical protein
MMGSASSNRLSLPTTSTAITSTSACVIALLLPATQPYASSQETNLPPANPGFQADTNANPTSAMKNNENAHGMDVKGESLVLAKTNPGKLCFDQLKPGSLNLCSSFEPGQADGIVYVEGRDYLVDYPQGTVARTVDSRIPDYATWKMVLKRKDQPSLLNNDINHPNDFGHWLYAQAFEALRF